jgi:hypothetical protein
MRLLKRNNDGVVAFTDDFIEHIPRYAILSHTWGAEEVTLGEMMAGTGKSKAGYDKIQFCGEQTRRDGSEYFWVDTCCIDKLNNTELTEAINSTYRWYRNAAKCYVYLRDVSTNKSTTSNQFEFTWEPTFRGSRWFTRDWTLQELLAPSSAEFFSQEGDQLGDKRTLEKHIHDITGIAIGAFQGNLRRQSSHFLPNLVSQHYRSAQALLTLASAFT